jgi:hypothetical protein
MIRVLAITTMAFVCIAPVVLIVIDIVVAVTQGG